MKIMRIGTGYIITIWILVVALSGSMLTIGYRRNRSDLRELMLREAHRLVETVAISAHSGIHALDEVEYLTAGRLLENARLIERLSRDSLPGKDVLSDIAGQNDLYLINILDSAGESLVRYGLYEHSLAVADSGHRSEVVSVLSGETREAAMGFMEDRYYRDKRYGVVVARDGGGAVVVHADSEEMLEFRKTVGLGTLLGDIGRREGVVYAVLQDEYGIIAASEGVSGMTRIEGDPFLSRAAEEGFISRFTDYGNNPILEVAYPLLVDDVSLGLLRVGLSTATIDAISRRAIRHFFYLFIVAMISGVFLFIFMILRQNYMILDAEHDRILGDVRRMEEENLRAERLASMGRLAAGVAHEIRNPLNAISIITQRLKAEFTPVEGEGEYKRYLTTVGGEVGRISGIIDQFLKFARPPELSPAFVSATKILNDVLALTEEQARAENITVEFHGEREIECVCDADQLKQALLNVVLNAFNAGGSGGKVWIHLEKDSGFVRFSIADSGEGIGDELRTKIFEPYYTTKDNGNGLGLSEVHRIVTAHGGTISVTTPERGGAEFTISIPINGARQ